MLFVAVIAIISISILFLYTHAHAPLPVCNRYPSMFCVFQFQGLVLSLLEEQCADRDARTPRKEGNLLHSRSLDRAHTGRPETDTIRELRKRFLNGDVCYFFLNYVPLICSSTSNS